MARSNNHPHHHQSDSALGAHQLFDVTGIRRSLDLDNAITRRRRVVIAAQEYDDDNGDNGDMPSHKEIVRILYTWYGRMGHPSRETMKKKILLVEPDITEKDIDELPWLRDGQRLNIVKMNAILLK